MLSQFLDTHRCEVLASAEQMLRRRLPEGDRSQLVDHLPVFLDEIIAELRTQSPTPQGDAEIGKAAARHGEQCEKLGVDIATIVFDYGVLCESIAELAQLNGVTVSPLQWQTLTHVLDVAISAAVSQYRERRDQRDRRRAAEHLGSVAHELRNALSGVMVAYESIRNGRAGASGGRTTNVLERQLKQLVRLTNDLLLDSKICAGNGFAAEVINLKHFVDDIVLVMDVERQIRIEVQVPADLELVADARRLTSALTNVVQNAIKFTRDAGRISLRARLADGGVVIEVEDECGGLSEGEGDELFAPFVQHHLDARGVGLGLAIVRQAVVDSGGTVSVRNLPGQGCVFTLQLPSSAMSAAGAPDSASTAVQP